MPCAAASFSLHGARSRCSHFQANHEWIDAVNAEGSAGHGDWRLPRVKELQSIVDYLKEVV
jgi:hypothetical protein